MAGNWKMNLNHVEAVGLVQKLAWTLRGQAARPEPSPRSWCCRRSPTCAPCRPWSRATGWTSATAPRTCRRSTTAPTPATSRRACWPSWAAAYVMVGHSERRQYHGEDDALVNAKAKKAVERGLTPIVCVGEGLEVRQERRARAVHPRPRRRGAGRAERRTRSAPGDRVRAGLGHRHRRGGDPGGRSGGLRRRSVGGSASGTAEASPSEMRILYGGSVKAGNVARRSWPSPTSTAAWSAGPAWSIEEFSAIARFYDLPAL